MNNDEHQDKKKEKKQENSEPKLKLTRRDILKGLVGVPFGGALAVSAWEKIAGERAKRKLILDELGLIEEAPSSREPVSPPSSKELIRVGVIGFGGRGESVVQSLGFAHPDWVKQKTKDAQRNRFDTGLKDFLSQEDLKVVITGVCDIFDIRAERALATASNDVRPGGGQGKLPPVKRYRHYQELLASPDIDAVIIATPDHWHARMIIDAVQAGKHVYCEKCMTRTEEEAHQVYEAVRNSGLVFQLGHQNRQLESHFKAREIVKRGLLGPINLVETTTNRNSPVGAWVYSIHEDAGPHNIDWAQFQEPAPHKVPFSLERFFRWRCWFDYGTGLSGDLLSHEYDAVNQIMDLGIPHAAVASGGIYFYKDGRDVPDVFQVVFEYPQRDLTLVYSATLSSGRDRGRLFMGHDASMEVGSNLVVTVDYGSTRYKDKIKNKIIDLSLPLFTFRPGAKGIDTVTSATERYFARRGLLYTYRHGRRVDTTHLHLKEWLTCIREGGQPSCNIDRGFEEAITCHMATRSYLEGRKVYWDPQRRKIV